MGQKIEYEVVANTKAAEDQINKVNESLKKVERSSKRTSKELSGSAQLGNEGVKALDKSTGGLATKFVAVGKAAKLSGKAMKTALISSGIGLAVALVATLVENWDSVSKLMDGITSDQEELLSDTQKTLETQRKQLEATNQMESSLKLQGLSEKEIRDIKRKGTEEIITQTELLLIQQKEQKDAQVKAAERNKNILKGTIAFLSLPLTLLLKSVDTLTTGLAKIGVIKEATNLAEGFLDMTSNLIFNPEEVEKEGNETIEETENALRKLKNTRDNFKLQDKNDSKRANEEKTKDEEDEEQRKIDAIERIRKGLIDTEEEERLEKLRLIQVDYDEQIRLAEEFYGKKSEKVLELEAAQKLAVDEQQAVFDEQDENKRLEKELQDQEKLIEKLEIDKEFLNQNFQAQREALTIKEQTLLNDTTLTEEQKTALENKFSDARVKIADAEADAKQTSLNGYANALSDISGVIGQETEAGKAIAIASSLVNTYAAINGQLAAFSGVAIPGYAIAQAIATGVVGFANVKKIASVKIPNSTGGGGGDTGSLPQAATPITPAFNIVGQSDTNQLADAIGGQTQQPVQAFVVSSEVTTAQELDRNIIDGASIG